MVSVRRLLFLATCRGGADASGSGINVGSRHDFEQMNKLIDANGLKFMELIDKAFKFVDAAEAFEYLWAGKHIGKIVIEMPK